MVDEPKSLILRQLRAMDVKLDRVLREIAALKAHSMRVSEFLPGAGLIEPAGADLVEAINYARPVVDFLERHRYDIGSLDARRVATNAPADARCLCVAVADAQGVDDLAAKMASELVDDRARALVKRVSIVKGALDTFVVVFVDIAAIGVRP